MISEERNDIFQTHNINQLLIMQNSKVSVAAPRTSLECVIEMFDSLEDPDIDIYNTLENILNDLSESICLIPIDSLYSFEQLFLSANLSDNFDSDDDDEFEEEEEEYRSSTVLGLMVKIIDQLVRSSEVYLTFFCKPDIIHKLFQLYNFIPKAQDLINTFAERNGDFIQDYRDYIVSIISSDTFSLPIAELCFIVLKVDDSIVPVDQFFENLNEVMKSQDTNLRTLTLKILKFLIKVNPDEYVPMILSELPNYELLDGDSTERYLILKMYKKLLDALGSFDEIVNDKFINFLTQTMTDEIDDDTFKLLFKILRYDYDLTPFLDYTEFFESFLPMFNDMQFYMQRSIAIFFSRFMKICTESTIQTVASSGIIDNFSIFLEMKDDDLLVLSSLSMICSILTCFPTFEWQTDVINAIEASSFYPNDEISQAAQEILKHIDQIGN